MCKKVRRSPGSNPTFAELFCTRFCFCHCGKRESAFDLIFFLKLLLASRSISLEKQKLNQNHCIFLMNFLLYFNNLFWSELENERFVWYTVFSKVDAGIVINRSIFCFYHGYREPTFSTERTWCATYEGDRECTHGQARQNLLWWYFVIMEFVKIIFNKIRTF